MNGFPIERGQAGPGGRSAPVIEPADEQAAASPQARRNTGSRRWVIGGLGTAVPETAIDQRAAARLASALRGKESRQARREELLYRQSGVTCRHVVALRDATSDRPGGLFQPATPDAMAGPGTAARMAQFAADAPALAAVAARKALDQAHIAAETVTHLVVVSCTGFAAPGVDVGLMQALQLRSTVERVQVGFMGCHGAINGLRVAQGLALAQPGACVLLCAVELCSLHFQYGDSADAVVANALFADGAAALVGWAEGSETAAEADGDPYGHFHAPAGHLRATGSCLLPDSTAAMTWNIGDHGFAMTLGAEVPALIATHLRGWLETWLSSQGESIASVAAWAIHPGGPRLLDAVRNALGLAEAQVATSRQTLADCGNMSSPTMLFILERLCAAGKSGPCVLLGFGPGLVAEAALVDLSDDRVL